jgi:hypothetical protein
MKVAQMLCVAHSQMADRLALQRQSTQLADRVHDTVHAEQRQERQSIREARLRVELAQMKLEKHMQSYYRKYGIIPDETDSESEESDSVES